MKWLRFLYDERGVSATEFAVISPILIIVVLAMIEGWSYTTRVLETRAAVQAGAKFVLQGGSDDVAIRTAALSAWENKPSDGDIEVERYCSCGDTVTACATLCLDTEKPPATFVNITATATVTGLIQNQWLPADGGLLASQVIRVR